ncbi:hypothetical protein M5689_006732 [Euphorbia peplus]|nr:hypothetical protein M5689_006732 [Euphorbia peplus]
MGYLNLPSKQYPCNVMSCKKHPKHKQSPGVCSICLSQKLSQVSSSSSSSSAALDSSCSSYLSSSSSSSSCSSYASPVRYNSNNKQGSSSLSNFFLTKSRSLVFISTNKHDNDKKHNVRSFLSKLLRPSGSKKNTQQEGLQHSRTMRELRHMINITS